MNQPLPPIEAARVQEQEREMLLDLLWELRSHALGNVRLPQDLVERLSAILDVPPNIPAGVKGATQ